MLGKNELPEDILGAIEIPTKEDTTPLWEEKLEELEAERAALFSVQASSETIYPMSLDDCIEEKESISSVSETIEEIVQEPEEKKVENFQSTIIYEKKPHTLFSSFWFLIKYITTSSVIFGILLLTTNFQAYYAIGYNLVFQEKMLQKQEGLINSVQAGNIEKEAIENLSSAHEEETLAEEKNFHSLENFVSKAQNQDVNLDITITPYENRIVIPKIGKNIPLMDVKEPKVSGLDELNDIFMKELESGVVRYPGSAKPGTPGNAFIFGHSSNFPWIDGDYNNVFALLDNVEYGDEVTVYYNQEKYTYKIYDKKVIKPGDVSVLKKSTDHSEITLMTCWPIGTDINRLVLIGELVLDK